MNITDQAAKVLAEIDAALAIMESQTNGRWIRDGYNIKQPSGRQIAYVGPHHTPPHEYPLSCRLEDERNGDGIAAARTVCPTALRCLKTAIEGLLYLSEYSEQSDECGCYKYASEKLTTLINQWNENK